MKTKCTFKRKENANASQHSTACSLCAILKEQMPKTAGQNEEKKRRSRKKHWAKWSCTFLDCVSVNLVSAIVCLWFDVVLSICVKMFCVFHLSVHVFHVSWLLCHVGWSVVKRIFPLVNLVCDRRSFYSSHIVKSSVVEIYRNRHWAQSTVHKSRAPPKWSEYKSSRVVTPFEKARERESEKMWPLC